MEGYQVSNQCMALVRDKCLVPTRDAPELGYVKESTNHQYVPDVFYKHKDEYGNEVTKIARPLPVEYLLVDVPVSTPKAPKYTFTVFNNEEAKSFPIENRPVAGHLQDFNALSSYLNQFPPNTPFLRKACDLHFLAYIATMDFVHIRDYIGPLLEAIRTQDEAKANDWANSEHWATVSFILFNNIRNMLL
jgi:nuclear protein localization family protein 4